jgi:hypothetical protein
MRRPARDEQAQRALQDRSVRISRSGGRDIVRPDGKRQITERDERADKMDRRARELLIKVPLGGERGGRSRASELPARWSS